jgi:hypothetical protein
MGRRPLDASTGDEAELHGEAEDDGNSEGEGGPRGGTAETPGDDFDKEYEDEDTRGEEKAIPDEDADGGDGPGGACGTGVLQDALNVEGREETTGGEDSEDDQKYKELKRDGDGFFHGWLAVFLLLRMA